MKTFEANSVWISKKIYDDAETQYYEKLSKVSLTPLAEEVAKARQQLIKSRDKFSNDGPNASCLDVEALKFIETRVIEFQKSIDEILHHLKSLTLRVSAIENAVTSSQSVHEINLKQQPKTKSDDEDEDVDLFASDSEEESMEAAKIREARLTAYAAKKSKKPVLIAKSSIIIDVKPWEAETDMKLMEDNVRKIATDGLLWGASKLVPLAYGIHKLQISCVVEDEKVSIDWLTEQLEALEDYVQSVDIVAFNKI
ncbi:hypothetical protein ABEB36_012165 [Hypothenemus hampei]|uniref:Elongation factor 1-delta n=1 Tax=Hypothenemus hampei TaxID=57062 RepID=A0ABD1EAZ1_HYPHA